LGLPTLLRLPRRCSSCLKPRHFFQPAAALFFLKKWQRAVFIFLYLGKKRRKVCAAKFGREKQNNYCIPRKSKYILVMNRDKK